MSNTHQETLNDLDLRLSATHDLKCDTEYFQAVKYGKKPFEVRNNDRDFHVGDYINLREYDRVKQWYTGEVILKIKITYVLKDYPALVDGFVVLGLELRKTNPALTEDDLTILRSGEAYWNDYNETPVTNKVVSLLSSPQPIKSYSLPTKEDMKFLKYCEGRFSDNATPITDCINALLSSLG